MRKGRKEGKVPLVGSGGGRGEKGGAFLWLGVEGERGRWGRGGELSLRWPTSPGEGVKAWDSFPWGGKGREGGAPFLARGRARKAGKLLFPP